VYDLSWVGDPRVSPDGSTVAYTVVRIDRDKNSYASAIWLVPADGSRAPQRLTSGTKKDSAPRWSPDGRSIAFTSTRDKDEAQLYVIAVDGGEARRLTDMKEAIGDVAWSPDGTQIAFSARIRPDAYDIEDDADRPPRRFTRLHFKLDNEGWTGDRRKHVFVVAADGSAPPAQLTFGDFEDEQPAWSPDGRTIAFASARDEDWDIRPVVDVYLLPAAGGDPERLTAGDGICSAPSWSPDGARIAFLYTPGVLDDPHHGRIAVVDVASRARTVLTEEFDRNCAPYPTLREPVWDGDDLLFVVEDAGNVPLYRVGSTGAGKPEPVVEGDRWITGFDIAGGTLAVTISDPTHLAELFVNERRLSDASDEFTRARAFSDPERFFATSRDGTEVEAWIMRPVGFDPGARYPVLLNIHGGPFSQYGNHFFDEFHVYTGAGYVVVYANPRGSSGYSEAWGRAIRGPGAEGPGMGTVDYEDCIAVIEKALDAFEFCDPERIGVIGGSYGGYMTSWIVSHDDRFTAAISERAVNMWPSMFGSSDLGWEFRGYVGSYMYEDSDAWEQISPQTYAANITTPLLILHSENDLRCNIEQAEQLFTTLRLLKRPVELVRFPGEGHELSRSGSPLHRVMRFEIILEWFGRYLKST
ncbi:MAG TPA: S9 family peptidase, partial [Actinomycetota bacterium]|nr:S9 family peptidase [Actinomycetota bacterium]